MNQPLLRFSWDAYTREKLYVRRRVLIRNICTATYTASLQVRADLSMSSYLELFCLLTTNGQVSKDAFELPGSPGLCSCRRADKKTPI